ncbi:Alpha/Beta hydrolase protein [Mycena sp. CBHHK59/15]|nr:Alpha/Beta hydrolase protein [Mycena sp. CBHHK59/15]
MQSSASPLLKSRGISSSLYDDLVLYTKYPSAAYSLICPSPLGNTLVQFFLVDSMQGFIARDDTRKEIVLSFRGIASIADTITLYYLNTDRIKENSHVHAGFLAAYNSVADDVLATVQSQVANYPDYSTVVTGHSLGRALAALGAPCIKTAQPNVPMKLYTFGEFPSHDHCPLIYKLRL